MERKKPKKIWTDVNEVLGILFSDKFNELEAAPEVDEVETDTDEGNESESESSDEYDDESDTDNSLYEGEVTTTVDLPTDNFVDTVDSVFSDEYDDESDTDNSLYEGEVTTTVDLPTDNFVDTVDSVFEEVEVNMEEELMLPVGVNDGDNGIETVQISPPPPTTTVDLLVDTVDSVFPCSVDSDIDFMKKNNDIDINTALTFEIPYDDLMEISVDAVDNEVPCFSGNVPCFSGNRNTSSSEATDEESENLIQKWSEGRKAKTARSKIQQEVRVHAGYQRKHVRGGPQLRRGARVRGIRGPRIRGPRGGDLRGSASTRVSYTSRGGADKQRRPRGRSQGRPRGRSRGRPRGCPRGPGRGRLDMHNVYVGDVHVQVDNADDNALDEWKWEKVIHKHFNEVEDNEVVVELENSAFHEVEGLIARIDADASILDFVQLYLTDELFKLLVTETNRFAAQYLAAVDEATGDNSYVGKWENVTLSEMKKFIGVILLMGIIYKPAIPMYWSSDELFSTPIFSELMTRNRFQLILKFLHFNNNLDPDYDINDENRDRLHKCRPVLDIIKRRCKSVWYPGQHLSVDESLVLFKGRVKFRQYIKTKRARFGIKLYELTTSDGITLDLFVYSGKGMFYGDDRHSEMPSTERIPSVLMGPYLGKGHILFTDNYYTSPTLASFLLSNRTHLCGTIKKNRKHFPKELASTKLQKGESAFFKKVNGRPMLAVQYRALKDKAKKKPKVVFMLSTCHDAITKNTGTIDHRSGLPNIKPLMTMQYNKHMGGVDRVDQQLNSLKHLRKSYKWYKKLVFRLFSQVILNAHKVYQRVTGKKDVTFLMFLRELIIALVTQTENIAADARIMDDTCTRLTGRHFISARKPLPGDNRPSKQCKVCYARKKRTDKGKPLKTVYICRYCPSEPGLHPECFEVYHTVLDYSLQED